MLAVWLAAAAWVGPTASPRSAFAARSRNPLAIVEATAACVEEQKAEFFALMPSEKLPEVSLDLRLFASKKDDKFQAKVFARQEGTVARWTDVGTVAVVDEAKFEAAVAKQRALIERWAYEVCNDFETNALLLNRDEPVELGWAVRPPKAPFWEKQPTLKPVPVAMGAAFEPSLRCGFLGKVGREYRGGGATARYERIVLGQPPEKPEARNKHWGASGGPYGVKGIAAKGGKPS